MMNLFSLVENFIFPMFMSINQYLKNIKNYYPVRDFSPTKIFIDFQYLGEYVGGAVRWEDLILYAAEAGFTQPRLVTAEPVTITNEDIQKAIGKTKFVSAIFRCFKLPCNDNDSTEFNIPYQLTYEIPFSNLEEEFFFDHSLQFKVKTEMIISL